MKNKDCIFCQIVDGTSPSHKIWEDEDYLAFLSTKPNTEGVTIVIPKVHYPSYVFALPDDVLIGLTLVSKEVALILDEIFPDVGTTASVTEGYGINHAHVKLFPLHGTALSTWQPIQSQEKGYVGEYKGYVSSHASAPADVSTLAELAKKIRDYIENKH